MTLGEPNNGYLTWIKRGANLREHGRVFDRVELHGEGFVAHVALALGVIHVDLDVGGHGGVDRGGGGVVGRGVGGHAVVAVGAVVAVDGGLGCVVVVDEHAVLRRVGHGSRRATRDGHG